MATERCRNWTLITYHPETVIEEVMRLQAGRIRHFAYILHDKDTDDEGKPLAVHYHLLIQLNNAMTLRAVQGLFPPNQNTLGQAMRDKADCFNYLDHADKSGKYHYSHELIKSDDIGFWERCERGESDDKTMLIIDDIIACVSFRELAKRYGRDLVLNYQKYRDFAERVNCAERPKPNLPDGWDVRDIPCSQGRKPIPVQCTIFEGKDGTVIIDNATGEIVDFKR